jgi:hypothetical protein
MRDISHNEVAEISFRGGARTAPANGEAIVDLQGFNGAGIVVLSGTITDGTAYTFELKHGDQANLSDAAAVPDSDLTSGGPGAGDLEPTFVAADDHRARWFGYVGSKRYLRIDLVTVTGSPSTGGYFMGYVVKGHPRHAPVA